MRSLTSRRSRTGTGIALTGLAALALIGTAACSPSGSSSASSPSGAAAPSGAASPRHQAMQAYTQCLSQHGVTLPAHHGGSRPSTAPGAAGHQHRQPGTPPPGVDPQTWTAAQSACASVRPTHTPKPAGS